MDSTAIPAIYDIAASINDKSIHAECLEQLANWAGALSLSLRMPPKISDCLSYSSCNPGLEGPESFTLDSNLASLAFVRRPIVDQLPCLKQKATLHVSTWEGLFPRACVNVLNQKLSDSLRGFGCLEAIGTDGTATIAFSMRDLQWLVLKI